MEQGGPHADSTPGPGRSAAYSELSNITITSQLLLLLSITAANQMTKPALHKSANTHAGAVYSAS